MHNAFPLFLASHPFLDSSNSYIPNLLKDVGRKCELPEIDKLRQLLESDLMNASLQDQGSVEYFLFIAESNLLFYLFNMEQEGFQQTLDRIRHRIPSLRNVQHAEVNLVNWETYLLLIAATFDRILRYTSIEEFEQHIDQLNWSNLEADFIPKVSTLIGYTYLHETAQDQQNKSRLWLQKSIMESDKQDNLVNHYLLASLYIQNGSSDSRAALDRVTNDLTSTSASISRPCLKRLFESALFEINAHKLALTFTHFDDEVTQLESCQQQLNDLEILFNTSEVQQSLPDFSRAEVESVMANLYVLLYSMTSDSLEENSFRQFALKHIDKAISISHDRKAFKMVWQYQLEKARIATRTEAVETDKEIRDIFQHYKRSHTYPKYVAAAQTQAALYVMHGQEKKAFDIIQDLIKQGNKRLDEGGFSLMVSGFALANEIFSQEITKPGTSWVVGILDTFFEHVQQMIVTATEQHTQIGRTLIEEFRIQYTEFEPISHFNIKVYFQYQLNALKMMLLGNHLYQDALSLQIGQALVKSLEHANNPLSFIQGTWEEFKNVPNDVRNKTLNKCINISKGDLPMAAEHLDFSYRNLRSYITFKEVQRLGFFLDMQETENRQLELGIRYMFYDLYKKGTIFEVVFDMPKFLVNHAKSGFYSQDLEEALNIKGTTAKKYIKIMMEIGLIRQEKTSGRKHFYRLIRENIMKRLGKDQNTLIAS